MIMGKGYTFTSCCRTLFSFNLFNPMKRKTFVLLALVLFATSVVDAAWDPNRIKPLSDDKKAKVLESLPAKSLAKPKKERRVLVFYRCEGFVHSSISAGNYAINELGKKTGALPLKPGPHRRCNGCDCGRLPSGDSQGRLWL